jgi:hypothetical protein
MKEVAPNDDVFVNIKMLKHDYAFEEMATRNRKTGDQ